MRDTVGIESRLTKSRASLIANSLWLILPWLKEILYLLRETRSANPEIAPNSLKCTTVPGDMPPRSMRTASQHCANPSLCLNLGNTQETTFLGGEK